MNQTTPDDHHIDDNDKADMFVGEILRRTRKQYGQSLRDVSAALRIRPQQLEALEKGEWHRLPGKVYTIGFVRSYAEYLGLDGEKIVRLLKMQSDGFSRLKPNLRFPAPPNDKRAPGWLTVIIAILLFCVTIYVWEQNKEQVFPDKQDASIDLAIDDDIANLSFPENGGKNIIPNIIPSPYPQENEKNINENNNLDGRTIELSTLSTDTKISDEIDSQTSNVRAQDNDVDPDDDLNRSVDNQEKINDINALEEKKNGDKIIESDMPSITSNGITIRSVKSSWVEIKDSQGQKIFARVMRPGDKYIVPSDKGDLVLSTGNAGGLAIIINDKELGQLGRRGSIVRGIELSEDELKRYIEP